MKKIKLLILVVCLSVYSCKYVDPTEVVLRVDEVGDDAGKITILDVPGKYSIAGWSATDYSFPITEENYRWTASEDDSDYGSGSNEAIVLQIEGNDCTLDVGIRFYVDNKNKEGLKHLVTKYPTRLSGVVDGLLYEMTRSSVKEEFEGQSLDSVMDNLSKSMRGGVTKRVKEEAKAYAINVLEVYDISGLNAPESVMEAKKQTQQEIQLTKRAEENQKRQAIQNATNLAKAETKTRIINQLNKNAPSKAVLMQQWIEKWNGVQAPGGQVVNLNDLK